MPTKGENPKKDTWAAASIARNEGITISFVGIRLDEDGEEVAKKVAEIGEGRFYVAKDLENLDQVILEDYYAVT